MSDSFYAFVLFGDYSFLLSVYRIGLRQYDFLIIFRTYFDDLLSNDKRQQQRMLVQVVLLIVEIFFLF